MRRWSVAGLVAACACACACGDMMNNAAIHAHVDDVLARAPAAAAPAPRARLAVGALVPGFGSYELDHAVFGDVRPSAIVFDWILGGLVPAALVGGSFVAGGSGTRDAMRWTALGLYATTRVAVEIVGNLHVSEYDDYLDQRMHARVAAVSIAW